MRRGICFGRYHDRVVKFHAPIYASSRRFLSATRESARPTFPASHSRAQSAPPPEAGTTNAHRADSYHNDSRQGTALAVPKTMRLSDSFLSRVSSARGSCFLSRASTRPMRTIPRSLAPLHHKSLSPSPASKSPHPAILRRSARPTSPAAHSRAQSAPAPATPPTDAPAPAESRDRATDKTSPPRATSQPAVNRARRSPPKTKFARPRSSAALQPAPATISDTQQCNQCRKIRPRKP